MTAMIPFESLSARCVGEEVQIAWKCPPGAHGSVVVWDVAPGRDGSSQRVRADSRIDMALRDCPIGCMLKLRGALGGSVRRKTYFACLTDIALGEPEPGELRPEYLVSVIIGEADVDYCISSTPLNKQGCARHIIRLRSSNEIDQGILQYSYEGYGCRIAIPFPGIVQRGTTAYCAFYTPIDSEVSVEPSDRTNSGIRVKRLASPLGLLMPSNRKR